MYSETWKTPQPDQLCEFCSLSEPHTPMWRNLNSKQATRSVHNLVQWSHTLMSKTRKPLKREPWHGLPTINGKLRSTFVAHNETGARLEFQEGIASTRLYTNATCHSVLIWNCLLEWQWVSSGIEDVTTISITKLPQFPYFTHLHQTSVAKTQSPFHCSQ